MRVRERTGNLPDTGGPVSDPARGLDVVAAHCPDRPTTGLVGTDTRVAVDSPPVDHRIGARRSWSGELERVLSSSSFFLSGAPRLEPRLSGRPHPLPRLEPGNI